MIKDLLKQVWTPICWFLIVQTLLFIPGDDLPDTSELPITVPHLDKFIHVILFAGFVFFWCYYFSRNYKRRKTLKWIFAGVSVFALANGILAEFIQGKYIPNRSFDIYDMVADAVGVIIAYIYCLFKLLPAKRRSRYSSKMRENTIKSNNKEME